MQKVLKTLMCILLLISLSACGNTKESVEITQVDEIENIEKANTLIVYFSRTGNTKRLVEGIKEQYGYDTYEIIPKIAYSDEDINYHNPHSRSSIEQNDVKARPKIQNTINNLDDYDVIILAYPIWWGEAPRIIYTFLESYNFSNKTIIPFCTSASSGIGDSDKFLHDLVSKDANWIAGKRFATNASINDVTNWLDEVYPKNNKDEDEKTMLKMFINDKEIPVTWENNDSILEIMNDCQDRDIVVEMSMYGGNEQFGNLGKTYASSNSQMTTSNGDIVLYNDSNIVVFYGSNSWSYTKLGKMDLSRQEVVDLLANGDVTLTLTRGN